MTAWARVSVAGPSSSIDVGLPTGLPITDFLDELVARLAGEPEVADPTLEWTLSPLGGAPLAPGDTLRDAEIHDGTWLLLREGPAEEPAVLVDDTLDALTEVTGARHGSWSPRAARIAGAVGVVAASAVGAGGLGVAGISSSTTVAFGAGLFAAVGAVMLIAAALYAGRREQRDPIVLAALCPTATLMAAAAGFAVVPGSAGAPRALLAAVAATVAATLTLRYTRVGPIAHIATITLGCLATVAAAAALAGLSRPQVAALIAVLALLGANAAPRLTVAVAKIPLPPVPSPGEPIEPVESPLLPTIDAVDAVSSSHLPDVDALVERAEHARSCLTGICAGTAVAAATASVVLGVDPPDWRFTAIVVIVGLTMMLRGRSHTDLLQASSLVGGGIAAIIGSLGATVVTSLVLQRPALCLAGAATACGVATVAALIGWWAAGRTFSPVQRRMAELVEYALLVALLPLLLWTLEVYRMIREAW